MAVRPLPLPSAALRRTRRLDRRILVAVALVLVGVAGTAVQWGGGGTSLPVLEFAREVPAGTVLQAEDLAVTRVRLGGDTAGVVVPSDELAQLVGTPLAEPGHAHALVLRAQLGGRAALDAQHVAISLPVDLAHAVGGQLQPGDIVTVYAAGRDAGGERPAALEVAHVRVLAVSFGQDSGSGLAHLGSGPADQRGWVALAVSREAARALATAADAGPLMLVREGVGADAR